MEAARRIWEIDESFRRELQEISELKRGVLNIGINHAAGALWLPLILPEFHREYPAVTINLTQRSSMLFELDLLRGNIDLAFTTCQVLCRSLPECRPALPMNTMP